MRYTDFLVIGSGIGGLVFALKVARHFPDLKITIVTKSDESESNTRYAQGGIAIPLDKGSDSVEKHIKDTLEAGDGLCDFEIVEMVIEEGLKRFEELIHWGVNFDKLNTGEYDLKREGGHSANRVVHCKDITGLELEKILLNQVKSTANIKILSYHFAIDLITNHSFETRHTREKGITCSGVRVLNKKTGVIETISSGITLLATGGAGQVYCNTTNPLIATGDGIAMAFRAKAMIQNMEFIQFHPTALKIPGENPMFLISEAVRGEGAKLRTRKGELFMQKYDERGEMASRDIVSRAIYVEMMSTADEFVYLDCRELDKNKFECNFPNIFRKCKEIGINISKDMIPVVPAAHYLCGGITVNKNGQTNINRLYACGECSYTGLHGANRLASNSLLEALVFSHRCYVDSVKKVRNFASIESIPNRDDMGTLEPKEIAYISKKRHELQTIMSNSAGIVRTNEYLETALEKINILYDETKKLYHNSILSPQLCELRNLITIAYLIVTHSIKRKENRGGFYNINLEQNTTNAVSNLQVQTVL